MTATAAQEAVRLAAYHFADNLALAFVGGSYARGNPTSTSDIDVFVLLRRGDRSAEEGFAEALRDLHHGAGLSFDHCGEIFDGDTLETLLTFTEHALAAAPALQRSACYQADCPLSAFRKGDVVFKFLADPKAHVLDPDGRLPGLEERAASYFARWPMPRIQEHKKHLALPAGSEQARLAARWICRADGPQWTDTPTGIGLDRWFGDPLKHRIGRLPPQPVTTAPSDPRACPLPLTYGTDRQAFAAQCLASTHPPLEGP
ncbi:nucleotidyltransferase domain-containing protein [Yinghuangia sp. ASG 101]|uniref:nucleotidyltransferase domain-containing protein n=1 Tax=Yinghuangia sp. ASG 101 TaxID=2896848 RepID=UPI001E29CAA4|nr:nucleotidyltransferase domain-containing protein [Yinghuangia sp. ASG 101]UGQ14343.1 nucleotidyltransferase domain-containing protein [Yinghuangia sp. ASG 101]